jgi:hypothetical protein
VFVSDDVGSIIAYLKSIQDRSDALKGLTSLSSLASGLTGARFRQPTGCGALATKEKPYAG